MKKIESQWKKKRKKHQLQKMKKTRKGNFAAALFLAIIGLSVWGISVWVLPQKSTPVQKIADTPQQAVAPNPALLKEVEQVPLEPINFTALEQPEH